MIARHLLDSNTTIPTDNAKLRASVRLFHSPYADFTGPLFGSPALHCHVTVCLALSECKLLFCFGSALSCNITSLMPEQAVQFARPELALQYEEALRATGLNSIDPVIRDMGSGDAPALEIGEFEVNRGTRLMILGFNRVQLVR